MYALKTKLFSINIPIRIWTKIFDSVIVPIALYGSEVWGPLSRLEHDSWDKHPIETLHTEFCRKILNVQRKIPNNACRAELGRFPLLLNIQKRAITFWTHLNLSQKDTLHFKALKTQELNPENSALSQLMVKLTNEAPISTGSKQLNRTKQIMNHSKDQYLEHWKNQTKTQSRLNCYLTLNREYKLAEYLHTVRDLKQRRVLTKYRLSDHQLGQPDRSERETGSVTTNWL